MSGYTPRHRAPGATRRPVLPILGAVLAVIGVLATVGVLAGSTLADSGEQETSAETTPQGATVCRNQLALTFDDGPQPGITEAVMEVLQDKEVPAAFMMRGSAVDAHPELAKQVADAGYLVANHTYGHEVLTDISDQAIRRTIRRSALAFQRAGISPSNYFRYPLGQQDKHTDALLASMGLRKAGWDISGRDPHVRSADEVYRNIAAGLSRRGDADTVIMLHDGIAQSEYTLEALPRIIDDAREAGYCFVDFTDLVDAKSQAAVGR